MRSLIVTVLLLITLTHVSAQQDSIIKYRHTVPNLSYLGSYFTDLGYTLASPVKWKRKQWMMFGAASASTLLLMTKDLWVQEVVTTNTNDITHWSARNIFEPAGNYQYLLATSTAFYALGMIAKDDKHKRAALLAAKAYVVSGVVVQMLKRVGSRKRPSQFRGGDPNPYAWEGFVFDYHSFPSGHTTVAFAMATVYATLYKDITIIPVIAYTMATFSGLSRIHDDVHWASDVLAGAFLGWAVGKFIVSHDNKFIKTVPYVGRNSVGLSLQVKF